VSDPVAAAEKLLRKENLEIIPLPDPVIICDGCFNVKHLEAMLILMKQGKRYNFRKKIPKEVKEDDSWLD
jgi:hypothetical protein